MQHDQIIAGLLLIIRTPLLVDEFFNRQAWGFTFSVMATLTTETFDATTVDPTTVQLDDAGARVKGESYAGKIEDVDGDGDLDLALQFEDVDGTYDEGSTYATLTGETYAGQAIQGTDDLCIVP